MFNRTSDSRAQFEATYHEDYPRVLAYLRRRSDCDQATELAAEVFLRAWTKWDSAGNPPLPWLYGIARNVLLEFYRGRGRDQDLHLKVAQRRNLVVVGMDDAVAAKIDIRAAMAGLAEADQEILRLHTWEDLNPKEIAQVLDISPENARVRLHRARHRLAEKIKEPVDG
ncbi:RNA polymerase sigma factor, sigma-70 family [Corynebacterium mustelae]|uniref:RNA polymerase sigma factor, sigma-70 family n=1 Tax=Corynebacterium mustelae TaxID=571915 RepID=A0A0G3H0M3_9CORY|nr:RNA polymerase sigma factor [Corynebacterium mustelae]AKK05373.1 RNA polymerase sigma factor, sigma-70 family [Corynebacterium mustelae]